MAKVRVEWMQPQVPDRGGAPQRLAGQAQVIAVGASPATVGPAPTFAAAPGLASHGEARVTVLAGAVHVAWGDAPSASEAAGLRLQAGQTGRFPVDAGQRLSLVQANDLPGAAPVALQAAGADVSAANPVPTSHPPIAYAEGRLTGSGVWQKALEGFPSTQRVILADPGASGSVFWCTDAGLLGGSAAGGVPVTSGGSVVLTDPAPANDLYVKAPSGAVVTVATAPYAPFTPATLGDALYDWFELFGTSTRILTSSGALVQASSWRSGSPVLSQSTAGARPTSSAGKVAFDGVDDILFQSVPGVLAAAYPLPDGSGGDAGHGFTCTGLARDPTDGTWWVANDGRNIETNASAANLSSIVHLSADFATKLGEVLVGGQTGGPATSKSVQGLAFDTSDNTLWAAAADGYLYHYGRTGGLIGKLNVGGVPNALAYDPATDALVYNANADALAHWVNKATGAAIKTCPIKNSSVDHFWLDLATGWLWQSWGGNNGAGRVAVTDTASGLKVGEYLLPEALAIEGIAVWGGQLYVANDGYYHTTAVPTNRVLRYDLPPLGGAQLGSRFQVFGVARLTAQPSSTVMLAGGDDFNAGAAFGLFFPSGVSNKLRTIVNAGGSGVVDFTLPAAATTQFMFAIDHDLTARTATLYVNGVQVGTPTTIPNLTAAALGSVLLSVGANVEGSGPAPARFGAVEVSALGVSTGAGGAAARARIEGALAWALGLQTTLLASTHPYSWRKP